MSDGPRPPASPPRALTRLAEPIHAVSYYTAEAADFSDCGYKGWWHAYFGYRPAPMGAVNAATVVATFYNFAPRMVARAVPGVWDILSPADAIDMRRERVARSLTRIFGAPAGSDARPWEEPAARAVALLRPALHATGGAGRPLFAAYADLPWPREPLLALWHACTLLRELRGDSHNIALAAAEIDGVSAHVLMTARGYGNRATIQAIRGWNDDEWDTAVETLQERGWLDTGTADGGGAGGVGLTAAGRAGRSAIEAHTDALSSELTRRLGADLADVLDLLRPVSDHLTGTGEVSATWPPKHVQRFTASESGGGGTLPGS